MIRGHFLQLNRTFGPVSNKYKITVNGSLYEVDIHQGTLNGKPFSLDMVRTGPASFHVLQGGRSFEAKLVKADHERKEFVIQIKSNRYTINAKDRYDELLHEMGMDAAGAGKIGEVRAPMPGLVLDVMVKEGQVVAKGDPLLVLEAMKMENELRAPADGTIQKIYAAKGDKVEKGAVLVGFVTGVSAQITP